jgi:hypothetical protein
VRGFIGRSVAKRFLELRSALRSWMNPQYAKEFMKNFLKSKASLSKSGRFTASSVDKALRGIDRKSLLARAGGKSQLSLHSVSSRASIRDGSMHSMRSMQSVGSVQSVRSLRSAQLSSSSLLLGRRSRMGSQAGSHSGGSEVSGEGGDDSSVGTGSVGGVMGAIAEEEIPYPGLHSHGCLRALLPSEIRDDANIPSRDFAAVIEKWYKIADAPLLTSEFDAIVARFRNSSVSIFSCFHRVFLPC